MPQQPGTRLGPYEITAPIGAGGMGEVYRARDTKLGREVAIKVLPDAVTENDDRLARFEREAKVLASLNHPNVATLHAFEEEGDTRFLVMELVEGEDLADRLRFGALPVPEAIPIFVQIAEGLEAAHEKGILHRDLKPANIKLGKDGRVKILDFGLAKAMAPVDPSDPALPEAPTVTYRDPAATQQGQVLGTVAYMSPEQASGKPLDRRSDIWSFGVCLYEALAGRRAFAADDPSETLAAVLRDDVDFGVLPAVPRELDRLLRRCLAREPSRRLRDVGDARLELESIVAEGTANDTAADSVASPLPSMLGSARRLALAGLAAGTVLGALAVWLGLGALPLRESVIATPRRLSVNLPSELPIAPTANEQGTRNLAVSPDGRALVYVAQRAGERMKLVLRGLDDLDARPLRGTEGAHEPFFSPDGEWVGYLTIDGLYKVRLDGGTPQQLSDQGFLMKFGGCWSEDGFVYFVDVALQGTWLLGALKRVPENGGTAETVLELGPEASQGTPAWPFCLPGGRALLVAVRTHSWRGWEGGDSEKVGIEVLELSSGKRRVLVEKATMPRYVDSGVGSTGFVVFAQTERLMALPFDLDRLEPTGPAFEITDPWMETDASASAPRRWDVSTERATLVYAQEGGGAVLLEVDRTGTRGPVWSVPVPHWFGGPSVSPQGDRVAFAAVDGDIWIYDRRRASATRLTFDPALDWYPIWSPDGERILFSSGRGGAIDIYEKPADGTGEAEVFLSGQHNLYADSFTPDQSTLVYQEWGDPETVWDLRRLTVADGVHEPLVRTPFMESKGRLSPDGLWLAYSSNEGGDWQVYVQPFPEMSERRQVSTDGGGEPRWSSDGSELFYQSGGDLMVASVDSTSVFSVSVPRRVFEGSYLFFDVLDDEHFVMLEAFGETHHELIVVSDFDQELQRQLSN